MRCVSSFSCSAALRSVMSTSTPRSLSRRPFSSTMAFARLHGPVWGAVALVGLALSYTEPGAPRWIWLAAALFATAAAPVKARMVEELVAVTSTSPPAPVAVTVELSTHAMASVLPVVSRTRSRVGVARPGTLLSVFVAATGVDIVA